MKVQLERPEYPMEGGSPREETMPPLAFAYEVLSGETCEVCETGWSSDRTLPWPLCGQHYDELESGKRNLADLG